MERIIRLLSNIFYIIIVLVVVRAVAYVLGYKQNVPVIDPIIGIIFQLVKAISAIISRLLNGT
jgi:hypothetical protein